MSYARGTEVSEDRSRNELERMLQRYGCSSFQSGWDVETQYAFIGFRHGDTKVMIGLSMPRPDEFEVSPGGRTRNKEDQERAYWAERRRRWRALVLIVKAKLEAVASEISTLEKEFLSDLVLPNGQTLGQWAQPLVSEIQSGRLQLPAPKGRAAS